MNVLKKQLLIAALLLPGVASAAAICPGAQAAFDLLLPFAEKIAGKTLKVTLRQTAEDIQFLKDGGGDAEFERSDNGSGRIRVSLTFCDYPVDVQRVLMAHELGHAINPPYPESSDITQLGGGFYHTKMWHERPREIAGTARALEIYKLSGLGTDKFVEVWKSIWKNDDKFTGHVEAAFIEMHHKD